MPHELGGETMRRRWFLLGMLSGLILGISVAFISIFLLEDLKYNHSPAQQMPVGTTVQIHHGEGITPAPVPPDWKTLYFNGRPFYLIPLAANSQG